MNYLVHHLKSVLLILLLQSMDTGTWQISGRKLGEGNALDRGDSQCNEASGSDKAGESCAAPKGKLVKDSFIL